MEASGAIARVEMPGSGEERAEMPGTSVRTPELDPRPRSEALRAGKGAKSPGSRSRGGTPRLGTPRSNNDSSNASSKSK